MKNLTARIASLSLGTRFVAWFLLVSLSASSIIGYLSYKDAHDALEHEVTQDLQSLNDALANNVITYFSEQMNSVALIAQNSVFQNQTDIEEVQKEVEHYLEAVDTMYDVMILDKEGTVIAATNHDEIGLDKHEDAYFINTKEEPYIKDVYQSSSGVIGFTASAPLMSNGSFNGVVVARYKLDDLNTIMASINATGETYKAHLVDSNGYMFTATRFEGEEAILTQKGDSEEVKDALEKGEEFLGMTIDYRGKDVLASISSNKFMEELGKNWVLVASVDEVEVDAPVIALRNEIIVTVLILAFVIVLLALYASKSISTFVKKPIKNASEQLLMSSRELEASSQQVSSGAQQIGLTVQQIAKNSQNQSRQAEETSKSAAQLATSIQEISKGIINVSKLANKISTTTQEGRVTAENADRKLNALKDSINTSGKMVKDLSSKNKKIGEITKMITGIAEQTNMLALNAAIEAARAGEQGRGFAVVADEVRKLAEESGNAAKQIEALIKEILASNEQVDVAMDNSNKNVAESAETVSKALDVLKTIPTSIEEITANIERVSAATQQQTANTDQIMKNIELNASSAEEAAAGTEEASAAAEEQSAAMQQVAKSVTDLSNLAENLMKIVGLSNVSSQAQEKTMVRKESSTSTYSTDLSVPRQKTTRTEEMEQHIADAKKTNKKRIMITNHKHE